MDVYPARESHFAHRAIRLMFKSCFAQDAGSDAVALVTIVAHTEDAKRYVGPVTYYNAQLQQLLGFRKWERLNRARASCVDAGWLHYDNRGKHKPGIYWVTIPDSVHPEDYPLDEGLYPLDGYKQGYNDGYKAGYNQGYKCGDNQGDNEGYNQGEPPIPTPTPIPKEKKAGVSSGRKTRKKRPADPVIELPENLRGGDFPGWWNTWTSYRKKKRNPVSADGASILLRKLSEWGVSRSIAAIEHSISNDYKGIFEPNSNGKHAKETKEVPFEDRDEAYYFTQ